MSSDDIYIVYTGNDDLDIDALSKGVEEMNRDIDAIKARLDAIESNGWVTTPRLASNSITTPKISDNSVTGAKIAPFKDWT